MLILIIKIILTPIACIATVCNVFIAAMLWDERALNEAYRLMTILWTSKDTDINKV